MTIIQNALSVGTIFLSSFFSTPEQRLIQACGEGNLPEVQRLVEAQSVDLSCKIKNGMMPLHIACAYNHLSIVKYLVNEDAEIDALDDKRETPLFYATYHNNQEIVAFLLEQGALKTRCNGKGLYPLMIAVAQKNLEMVNVLLSRAPSKYEEIGIIPQALILAITMDEPEIVFHLLARSAVLRTATEDGITPLMYASIKGIKALAILALEKGEHINVRDNQQMSALDYARKHDHKEIEELIKNFKIVRKTCSSCNKINPQVKKCERCHVERYCDRSCQRKHWKIHKKICKSPFEAWLMKSGLSFEVDIEG